MRNNRGFTLVELIAVLVLLGFIGTGLMIFFADVYGAYIMAQSKAGTASTVQSALSRITLELQSATPDWIVSNGTNGSEGISYYSSKFMTLRTLRSKDGSIDLLPDSGSTAAYQLIEGTMTINYIDTNKGSHQTWTKGQEDLRSIQVTITVSAMNLSGDQDVSFSTRIIPRG